jgi:hypothetical protein
MTASAYANSTNNEASSYLVSPEIDLTSYTAATAQFEQALNKYASIENAKQEALFQVSTDGGTTWETLTIPSYPESLSWTFTSTGKIDLSGYVGKKVKLAFHYTSNTSSAGTWEVKNLKVTGSK